MVLKQFKPEMVHSSKQYYYNMEEQIYKIMLELAEEENEDLKNENDVLYKFIEYLEDKNRDLITEYNNLVDIKKRKN